MNAGFPVYSRKLSGGVAQLVEHSAHIRTVRGSSPFATIEPVLKETLRQVFFIGKLISLSAERELPVPVGG